MQNDFYLVTQEQLIHTENVLHLRIQLIDTLIHVLKISS